MNKTPFLLHNLYLKWSRQLLSLYLSLLNEFSLPLPRTILHIIFRSKVKPFIDKSSSRRSGSIGSVCRIQWKLTHICLN